MNDLLMSVILYVVSEFLADVFPCQRDDPRLDCAILRPMESDGDHFLAYYLTKDDETAIQFKEERLARSPYAPEEDEVRPKLPPSCRILMLTRALTGLCQSLMVRPTYHARRSEKATDLRLHHRRCQHAGLVHESLRRICLVVD